MQAVNDRPCRLVSSTSMAGEGAMRFWRELSFRSLMLEDRHGSIGVKSMAKRH